MIAVPQLRTFRSHSCTFECGLRAVNRSRGLAVRRKKIQETFSEGRKFIAPEILELRIPYERSTKKMIVYLGNS
jgi:hypothetical protein